MRSLILTIVALTLAAPVLALDYDQNVTPEVIFGSGNANGGFTVHTRSNIYDDVLEVGLRAKVRYNSSGQPENTYNSDGSGGYYFLAGGPGGNTPTWNFEWHFNSDSTGTGSFNIDTFDLELGLDYDPSPTGTNFVVFDPLTPTVDVPFWDHSFGDNSTPNGGGVVATNATEYLDNLAQLNVVQQSWAFHWFDAYGTFDPNEAGVYDIYLKVFINGIEIAESTISVSVGGAVANENSSWSDIKALYR